jgi:hypothetical protein
MPTDEEYGDMLVDEGPDEDKEAMDKYLNMELVRIWLIQSTGRHVTP